MENLITLIVDDEEIARSLLANELRKLGCRHVHDCANAKDAIQKFKDIQPDILFLDINMPTNDGVAQSGLDVLQTIKELNDKAFVVMVSGDGGIDTIKTAINRGAKGFVVKPYKIEKLKQIVLKCVENKNRQ